MKAMLNGVVYERSIDGATVYWESNGAYRHWCFQKLPGNSHQILVVMLNPGSLKGDGSNLAKDTTLRILRDVFSTTTASPFVINLYDFASAKPNELFANWEKRDGESLIYQHLRQEDFAGIMYAYGDYGFHLVYGREVNERISFVRSAFKNLKEVELPCNARGSPKHPMVWQTQRIKPVIARKLNAFLKGVTCLTD